MYQGNLYTVVFFVYLHLIGSDDVFFSVVRFVDININPANRKFYTVSVQTCCILINSKKYIELKITLNRRHVYLYPYVEGTNSRIN